MSENPSSKTYQRRVRKLGEALSDGLSTLSLEAIVQRVDPRASDQVIDSALLHAFALCRTRVELSERQIARQEANMERIRELNRRPTFKGREMTR